MEKKYSMTDFMNVIDRQYESRKGVRLVSETCGELFWTGPAYKNGWSAGCYDVTEITTYFLNHPEFADSEAKTIIDIIDGTDEDGNPVAIVKVP